jgi:hypothetical protein
MKINITHAEEEEKEEKPARSGGRREKKVLDALKLGEN